MFSKKITAGCFFLSASLLVFGCKQNKDSNTPHDKPDNKSEKPIQLTSIDIIPLSSETTFGVGSTLNVLAIGHQNGQKLSMITPTWIATDPTLVKIESKPPFAKITTLKPGHVEIIAQIDGLKSNALIMEIKESKIPTTPIIISDTISKIEEIRLVGAAVADTRNNMILVYGTSVKQPEQHIIPNDQFSFKSSDERVATVDTKGFVEFKTGDQTVSITVTANKNPDVQKTIDFSVQQPNFTSLQIENASNSRELDTYFVGETLVLRACGRYYEQCLPISKNVSWDVSDKDVITFSVDQDGIAKGVIRKPSPNHSWGTLITATYNRNNSGNVVADGINVDFYKNQPLSSFDIRSVNYRRAKPSSTLQLYLSGDDKKIKSDYVYLYAKNNNKNSFPLPSNDSAIGCTTNKNVLTLVKAENSIYCVLQYGYSSNWCFSVKPAATAHAGDSAKVSCTYKDDMGTESNTEFTYEILAQ